MSQILPDTYLKQLSKLKETFSLSMSEYYLGILKYAYK